MRKIIIGFIAVIFVGLFFGGYLFLTNTTPIQTPEAKDVQDIDITQPRSKGRQTVDTDVRDARNAEYFAFDEVTNEIKRTLGFKRLLNPGSESSRWEVENPYLIFYETGYECRIDADQGIFQTRAGGSSEVPRDAQLKGNVVIHLMPKTTSRMREIRIKMDDLTFSSERSEFSTDGPISVVSEQIELEGFGLILLFDTAVGRIDYLHIRDLERLRILNLSDSQQTAGQTESPETISGKPLATMDAQSSGTTPSQTEETVVPQETTSSPSEYYECILDQNVEIIYGNELVISGAEQVNIQNISLDADTPDDDPAPSVANASQRSRNSKQIPKEPAKSPRGSDFGNEVFVRCDGGIILKPMPEDAPEEISAASEVSVEMRGTPLSIARIQPDVQSGKEPIISCGFLEYTPAEDVLRLFTGNDSQEIVLNAPNSKGRIQTLGNVWWDRKNQQANVAGPGKVYLPGSDSLTEPSEIVFNGAMDLLFAPSIDLSASPMVQTINLTGGMNALLKQNGWYQTVADSAILKFDSENSLSQATLLGAVQFESMEKDSPQRAVAESATVEFGPQNMLTTARMEGGVRFDSVRNDNSSYAKANTATFRFDQSKIQSADLNGAVCLASDTGKLTSSDVTIDFKPDAAGTMQPEVVRTESNAVLETVSGSSSAPPTKFEARKIDYDLLTGAGLAHGPVRFTYYQPADPNDTTGNPWVPIVVMADKDAQFIADETRTIKQVVFNENVLVTRRCEQTEFTQVDNFHGDKLTVFLDKDAEDRTGITGFQMTEGRVFAQSQKFKAEEILTNVRLSCTEIAYDDLKKEIVAKGPNGEIQMDNSHVTDTAANKEAAGIDFKKPCYVYVTDFDSLQWNLTEQTIVADGQQDQLKLAYVPLADGKPEKYIHVDSIQFMLAVITSSDGKPELKRVFSDMPVRYTEKDINEKTVHTITGQKLEYDPVKTNGWVKIEGTPGMPVNVDNFRAPFVYVNPATGQLNTSLSTTPGILKTQ